MLSKQAIIKSLCRCMGMPLVERALCRQFYSASSATAALSYTVEGVTDKSYIELSTNAWRRTCPVLICPNIDLPICISDT